MPEAFDSSSLKDMSVPEVFNHEAMMQASADVQELVTWWGQLNDRMMASGSGAEGEEGGEGTGDQSQEDLTVSDQLAKIKAQFIAAYGEIRSISDQTGDIMAGTFVRVADSISNVLGDAIGDLATNMMGLTEGPIMIGRAFKNMAIGIIKDLTGMIIKMYIVSAIAKALGFSVGEIPMDAVHGGGSLGGGMLDGERAAGGPVTGGKTYLVGEEGPELFTPNRSGAITPNDKINGGGVQIGSLNLSLNTTLSDDPINIRRVASMLYDELKEVGTLHGPEVVNV